MEKKENINPSGDAMKRIEQIKNVVTPVDFSDNSKLIAESAAFLAGSFKASLVLVFVVQKFEDYSGFFVPQMSIPDFEQDLADVAQSITSAQAMDFLSKIDSAIAALEKNQNVNILVSSIFSNFLEWSHV